MPTVTVSESDPVNSASPSTGEPRRSWQVTLATPSGGGTERVERLLAA